MNVLDGFLPPGLSLHCEITVADLAVEGQTRGEGQPPTERPGEPHYSLSIKPTAGAQENAVAYVLASRDVHEDVPLVFQDGKLGFEDAVRFEDR